jgi:hypothetical protein
MKRNKPPKKKRSLNFPVDLEEQLQQLADEENLTFTQIVVLLCKEGLHRRNSQE